jgi:Fe-S cluster assembly ATP-binding protein
MAKTMLKIENLKVKSRDKEILKGIDLEIKEGEVQAVLGPNASGKSTLAQAIMGNPKYRVSGGKMLFEGKDISKLGMEKRAKLGLALSWQNPPAVKGLKMSQLLEKISKRKDLKIKETEALLNREVNLDFSGGEKKMSELLQIISLNPKLVIFDELDSGLDVKRIELASKLIKKEILGKNPKTAVLIITHSGSILNFLKPSIANVIVGGRIICRSNDYKKTFQDIKKYGYEKCKHCKLSSN